MLHRKASLIYVLLALAGSVSIAHASVAEFSSALDDLRGFCPLQVNAERDMSEYDCSALPNENEAYYNTYPGDVTNGGCFGDPVITQPLEEEFCGSFFAFEWEGEILPDTDWYSFTLTEETDLRFEAYADVAYAILVANDNCNPFSGHFLIGDLTGFQGVSGSGFLQYNASLPPGQYLFLLLPDFSTTLPETAYHVKVVNDYDAITCDHYVDVAQQITIPALIEGEYDIDTWNIYNHPGNPGAGDAYFEFTAELDCELIISTLNSAFDTRLTIFAGGSPCSDPVGELGYISNDGPGYVTQAEFQYHVVAGQTYVLLLEGQLGGEGYYELRIEGEGCYEFPCDNFDTVNMDIEVPFQLPGLSFPAWMLPDIYNPLGSMPSGDLYLNFLPDEDCVVQISTCGSEFPVRLTLFEDGSPCSDPQGSVIVSTSEQTACGNGSTAAQLSVPVLGGTPYALLLESNEQEQGQQPLLFLEISCTEAVAEAMETPVDFSLAQNHPNPFNPTTTIEFNLPETSPVQLRVFNVQGQLVATLLDDLAEAGEHALTFNAANLPSGVYYYQLRSGQSVQSRKMILLK